MSRKIIGVTVGSPLPKPNLKQTDPRRGDYVKGKDIIPTKVSQLENDSGYLTEVDKQEIAEMAAELVEVPESGGNVDLTGVVKSVNGQTPDENGNVEIEVGSGSSTNAPQISLNRFEGVGNSGVSISVTTIGADGSFNQEQENIYDGNDGAPGATYIPKVTQIDADTVEFAFTPSPIDLGETRKFTVELPSGSGSSLNGAGIHIGPEPPADTTMLWVDTSDETEEPLPPVGEQYVLPAATADNLGGIKADPATDADTQPVRIGSDGKLYTAQGGGSGESAVSSGDKWFKIANVEVTEAVDSIKFSEDMDGKPLNLKKMRLMFFLPEYNHNGITDTGYTTYHVNDTASNPYYYPSADWESAWFLLDIEVFDDTAIIMGYKHDRPTLSVGTGWDYSWHSNRIENIESITSFTWQLFSRVVMPGAKFEVWGVNA